MLTLTPRLDARSAQRGPRDDIGRRSGVRAIATARRTRTRRPLYLFGPPGARSRSPLRPPDAKLGPMKLEQRQTGQEFETIVGALL